MIARWHIDVVRYTCKGLVPFQAPLRRLKRQLFPYRTDDLMDVGLLDDGLRMIGALRAAGVRLEQSTVLEVGSGWHPVIPLLFRLAGAQRVVMTDESRLMDAALVRSAERFIARHADALAAQGIPPPAPPAADGGETLDAMLQARGMEYLAPFDFAQMADRAVDVVISRAVLEHIRPEILEALLQQCHRVLAPDGYACHVVDNTDHYAHRDRGIDYVNFLKFADWHWRLLTLGPLSYTNRLRHSDYRRLLERSGSAIVAERRNVDERSLTALRSRRLAPAFRGRDPEDLATATSLFVARAAGGHPVP